MKRIIILSAAAMMLYSISQLCGWSDSRSANAQTTASTEIIKGEPKTVTLKITGMTCAGCAGSIHTALSKKNGIINDEVKYPGDVAIIKYDPAKIKEDEIIKIIEKAGYKASLAGKQSKKTKSKKTKKDCAPAS